MVFIGKDFGHVRDYSEEVAARIDSEVRRIVEEAYEQALGILGENRAQLDALAEFLLEYEKVNEEEFLKIMDGTLTVDLRRAQDEEKRAKEAERLAKEAEQADAAEKPLTGEALLGIELPETAAEPQTSAGEAPAEDNSGTEA